MQIHDEIIRGETYYREILLYTDEAKTQVLDWAGRTPRGVLLNATGATVAAFSCTVLDATSDLPQRLALVMSRAETFALTSGRRYEPSVMLDQGSDVSVSAITGFISVRNGAPPPVTV